MKVVTKKCYYYVQYFKDYIIFISSLAKLKGTKIKCDDCIEESKTETGSTIKPNSNENSNEKTKNDHEKKSFECESCVMNFWHSNDVVVKEKPEDFEYDMNLTNLLESQKVQRE